MLQSGKEAAMIDTTSPFNPSQFKDLAEWIDPGDESTWIKDEAGRVTGLRDKSGNGRDVMLGSDIRGLFDAGTLPFPLPK
jgi:hypothetical protein